jgi:ribosomal-protein-alanine N-acetyltransferase
MSVLARLLPGGAAASPSVSIAPMTRRDLRPVVAIESGTYPKPWSRSVFEAELAQVDGAGRYYVVARRGRHVAGYAGLWFVHDPDGDQAHVTNIVVAPDARRHGIGRQLMVALARQAIGRGCVAWTLEVRATNDDAQQLYRRFGFSAAGVRKRYYENTDDAIVMWCHDIQSADYAQTIDRLAASPRSHREERP